MFSLLFFSRQISIVTLAAAAVSAQVSPPVEPTPAQVEARVESMLAKLTMAQKIEMLGGTNGFYIHAEPTIGLPALRMADGPVGVRNVGPSTAYPAGIALAASFDAELAFDEGTALGHDSRARGVHFLLAPGVNIYRAPMNGRNFEYFGEDPYLTSRLAVRYIEGLQTQGVSATVKHFALNNEEYDRHHIDSVVDERTLHELYLPAFEAAVKEAHVGSIMDSYNLVNGVHASQSALLNQQIAKMSWKFDGITMSDWNSVYDGVAAANTGLDLEMPSAKFMNASALNGHVSAATIDDKIRRILRVAVRMGWLDRAQLIAAPVDDPRSRAVAHRVALESITLLKNDNGTLPLNPAALCTLAVIGPNGNKPVVGGGGSALVTSPAALSDVEALKAALPARPGCPGVVYARGIPTMQEIFEHTRFDKPIQVQFFNTAQPNGRPDSTRTADHLVPAAEQTKKAAALTSGRWTLDYTPTVPGAQILFLAVGRHDAITLMVDGKPMLSLLKPEGRPVASATVEGTPGKPLHIELSGSLEGGPDNIGFGIQPAATIVSEEARTLAAKADAVIVTAGYDASTEGEGFDRSFALPGGQSELIQQIAQRNAKTIVSFNAGGGIEMAPWLDKVPAVLDLYYPGEEGAPALAELLFGKASPEGHLPISIERQFADNPAHGSYYPGPGSTPDHPVIKLDEGVFLGYRYYAGAPVKPLFPFGHGLSYTSFAFSNLHVDNTSHGVIVTVDVKNTGARAGGEAVQVYVGNPSATVKRPAEELKAFRKVQLGAKESAHLEFTLDTRAFAYWSDQRHGWQADPGQYVISVGDSSVNLPLKADLTLAAPQGASQAAPAPAVPQKPSGAEYSLTVMSRKDWSNNNQRWAPEQANPTRVMEQLAGFTPHVIATDKWGGRMDRSAPATGYFYTKQIDGRWWTVDPAGHLYFHQAVVALSPSASPNAKAALAKLYGDQQTWMTRTHAFLLQNGFQGAGAWSNADLIRHSALQSTHPLAYTVNLDVMTTYGKKRGGLHDTPGHTGYPHDTIFVFDPEFETFVNDYLQKVKDYADDPALFGYFSDNEMPINRGMLDRYLELPHDDPGYKAARQFLDDHHAGSPTDDLRNQFCGLVVDRYASIVSKALRRYDPHHMYIGARFTGKTEDAPEAFTAMGRYADAISVNYYNAWTPDLKRIDTWASAAHKPIMITEWYVKGADSGMPNKTGAGWLVGTQAERGEFYQNYALALIESKNVVGWHWFKYQDNDPNDPHAELSNKDSNKGIVNIEYQPYQPLLDRMRQLNPNAYALADYFDKRSH